MNICRKALVCMAAVMLSLIMMSFTCTASENIGEPISLTFGGTQVQDAIIVKNTAYVPFRNLVAAIEPDTVFDWNNEICASVANGNGISVKAYSGKNYIEANGRIIYEQNAGNLNLDGVLYVPVRSVARAYSLDCTWDGNAMKATVSGTPTPILSGAEFYVEEDLYWLSRIISAESRGEPFEGQIAVGNVIINRKYDGSFPDTVYGVIFDRKFGTQFSPAASGSVYNAPTDSAVTAAKIALEGVEVVDALYFCASRVNRPDGWMARTRDYVATIGNHVFYW